MLTASFDISTLIGNLSTVAKVTGQEMKDLVNTHAALFIFNANRSAPGVINITAPYSAGKGKEAERAGQAGIDRDLGGVFVGVRLKGFRTIKQCFGKPMRKPVRVPTVERYPNVEAIYNYRRSRQSINGRKLLSRGRKQAFYVSKPKLKALRKKLYGRIGWACGAWHQAGMQAGLSMRGVPSWIRRHTGAPGSASVRITPSGFTIELRNRTPYGGPIQMANKARIALGYREAAMLRSLPSLKRAALRKAKLAA